MFDGMFGCRERRALRSEYAMQWLRNGRIKTERLRLICTFEQWNWSRMNAMIICLASGPIDWWMMRPTELGIVAVALSLSMAWSLSGSVVDRQTFHCFKGDSMFWNRYKTNNHFLSANQKRERIGQWIIVWVRFSFLWNGLGAFNRGTKVPPVRLEMRRNKNKVSLG